MSTMDPQPGRPSSFFLSYPGVDRAEARALAEGLRAAGLHIWCDVFPESLPAGGTWVRRLETALEKADGYLVLLGPASVEGWVRTELEYALRLQVERERQGRSFPLVPLCRPGQSLGSLPGFIGSFQGIELAEEPLRMGPEALGRLVERLKETLRQGGSATVKTDAGPFPGLEVFDEERSAFFFGRDVEIRELCERLGETGSGYRRWLQIEGPSGTGKSSLVRAGLVPAVLRGWIAGGRQDFQVALMRPGRRPVLNLAQAVQRALGKEGPSLARVEESLRASERGLSLVLREHLPVERGLLLVVDQLEELFTVADEAEQVRQFDALVGQMLEDEDRPFHLVTTVRSDFLGRYETLPWLGAGLNGASRYQLRAMRGAALRSAIEGPAALAGLRWEPGLPERLLADAAKSEGSGPLVAHVLHELWRLRERDGELLTHRAYEALEGVGGALRKSADAVVDGLGREGQERARRLLLSLVRSRGHEKATRQVATRAQVLEAAGGGEEAERVLARLSGGRDPTRPEGTAAGARLVMVSHQGAASGEDQVDLVHETLLSEWGRLRTWVEEHRKVLECRDDLEAAAQGWEAAGTPKEGLPGGAQLAYYRKAEGYGGRARKFLEAATAEERRRSRRSRMVIAGLTMGLVASLGAGSVAVRQWALAQSRLRDAVEVADEVVFLLDRKLAPIAGTAEVRRELMVRAEALQERLLAGAGENKAVLRSRMANHIQRGDLALTHEDLEQARTQYEAALTIVQGFVEQEPDDALFRDDLSVVYSKLGAVAQAAGDLAAARSFFEKDLEISKALADADPRNAAARRNLAVTYNKLGDVAQEAGDLAAARSFFEKELEISKALVEEDPRNALARSSLVAAYGNLGDVARAAGDLAAARSFFEKTLDLNKALAEEDPRNASAQRDLAISYNKLGDVAQAAGDHAAARSFFEKDLEISKARADADPRNVSARRDLTIAYNKLGGLAEGHGDFATAHAFYEKALELSLALAEEDPRNASAQRDLGIAYTNLGDVAQATGELVTAQALFAKALEISQALTEADPRNASVRRDLAISYNKLGAVAQATGDLAAARSFFEKGLELIKALVEADPRNALVRRNLSGSYRKLGNVAQAAGDLASARSSFEKGLELIKALAEEDPGNASLQRALAIAYDELGEVAQAAGDLAAARSFFEKELEVSQALAEADPRNSEWQFDLTISHMSLLTIARETQDGAAFRLHRDAMKQILERLEQLEREGRISEGSRLEALRQQYLQESAEPPPD